MSAGTVEVAQTGCHRVQFYADEGELADGVSDYVFKGLSAGGVVIVVASSDHRDRFEAELIARGIDCANAEAAGTYVALDATETVHRFAVGQDLDPVAFRGVMGGLIRGALDTGRRVYVYGEMVALLWDAGYVNAAIELESLWNELGAELPFELYCSYTEQSITGCSDFEALEAVCGLHSSVVGGSVAVLPATTAVSRDFPAMADAPRAARHFVMRTLRAAGEADLIDEAALVVTELASNAVVHARSEFIVSVSSRGDTVRISVYDADPVLPEARAVSSDAVGGRGLGLVAAVAKSWGVEARGLGKAVWADLRLGADRPAERPERSV